MFFSRFIPKLSRFFSCSSHSLATQQIANEGITPNLRNSWNICQSSNLQMPNGFRLLQNNINTTNHQSVRFRKYKGGETFKASAWKRAHKHGLETVLVNQGLKEAVWRKILKGRKRLFIVPRLMNYPPKSKKDQMQLPTLKKGLYRFYPYQPQVKTWKKV
ncbi:unnamed protein product [Mytilus coruscus]|uniref:Uncharacterized protein n=1 Tax=Mytilus coruscus TaxID=42192 RepID=A0A6J8B1Y3_MYTCO|nr:unnamed protein product [Mytilus coruscus]